MTPFYEDEAVTIFHGDCREIMPRLPRYRLLLTDPPYGIKADNRARILSRIHLAKPRDYGLSDWDNFAPLPWVLEMVRSRADWQIIWGGNYFSLPPSKAWLVWDKDNGECDYADCELAWSNLPTAVRQFTYRWAGMLQENMKEKEVRFHPTQKPVPLMEWCLGLVQRKVEPGKDGWTVVDPYMGSGSTLLAAKLRGWKAVGIDADLRYCETAKARLLQGVLLTA